VNKKKHHVVVIGAGFGGLYAVKQFVNTDIEVTLVDKRNFHLFQPLLYQVATGTISAPDISAPVRSIFGDKKNITVRLDIANGIDPYNRYIQTKSHARIRYDDLIVATGVSHHYFGNDEWEKHAPGLKSIEDAFEMRRRIFSAFEMAENETDPGRRKQLLNFVIIGGGPTGVELAGALADLAFKTLDGHFHNIDTKKECEIYLIEALPKVLPTFENKLSDISKKYLEKMGVNVLTNSKVVDITSDTVIYEQKGQRHVLETKTTLWGAGVRASAWGMILSEAANVEVDKVGRVYVKKDFSLPKYNNIFVIGDLARFQDKNNEFLPGVAPVAMQAGEFVAKLIKARAEGYNFSEEFTYKDKGSLAVIGRNKAVADLGYMKAQGFVAWILWIFVHICFLIGFDNKVSVLIKWALNYFNQDKGTSLIFVKE
tara:strand:- start:908 stop:2188 length:1281 start_codon:yes stop_codon:yes gene_type:complete